MPLPIRSRQSFLDRCKHQGMTRFISAIYTGAKLKSANWVLGPVLAKAIEQYQSELCYAQRRLQGIEQNLALVRLTLDELKAEGTVFESQFELVDFESTTEAWSMKIVTSDLLNPANTVDWAPQFVRLMGFESSDHLPRAFDTWAACLHPEDKDRSIAALSSYLRDQGRKECLETEYRLKLRDGSYRKFRARGYLEFNSFGQPNRFASVLQDSELHHRPSILQSTAARHCEAFQSDIAVLGHIVSVIDAIAEMPHFVALASLTERQASPAGGSAQLEIDGVCQLASKAVHTTRLMKRYGSRSLGNPQF